jgi:hypothetical protein
MSEIPRLSIERLTRLEELLTGQGAVVVERFRPPASPEAIAALEDYLGMPLPVELRTLYEWHDGTGEGRPDEHAACGQIGDFTFHTTAEAVGYTQECRDDAVDLDSDDPGYWWGQSWLAIGNVGKIACDCSSPRDALVPILNVDYHHVEVPGTVAGRSIGEMVDWWIEALECGALRYDTGRDVWQRDEALIPPEREALV